MKKTLQIELDSFFETIKGVECSITKKGYSEARQKISPTAFIKMADSTMSWYYGDDDFKTFNGYRLSAIDASQRGFRQRAGILRLPRKPVDCFAADWGTAAKSAIFGVA